MFPQKPFPLLNLVVEEAALERGSLRLVSGLSLNLQSGELLVVTGPNGSGKSTLLRALGGLFPTSAGVIYLAAPDATTDSVFDDDVSLHTHYLGHADALRGACTAAENLTFWAAMLKTHVEGLSPQSALDVVGLGSVADLPCAYLSAGQKRRTALARLLVAPRPIWLVDEPMTALDAKSQALVTALIEAHLRNGGMVAAATHSALGIANMRELQLGSSA